LSLARRNQPHSEDAANGRLERILTDAASLSHGGYSQKPGNVRMNNSALSRR